MNTDSTNVFDAAFSLPDPDRANLAYRLLQSLRPPNVLAEDDQRFVSELQRRASAYEAGETVADDWERVSQRLRAAMDARKPS